MIGSRPSEPVTLRHSRTAAQLAYQAEASGDLVAMSFPGVRRIAGWLFWLVFPLIAIASVAIAVYSIALHLGNQPDGLRGNYVANRSCARDICLVSGTFTSDDGRTVVSSLLGDPRWPSGSEHRVVYNGKGAEVIALGEWDPTTSAIAAVAGVAYLSMTGYFVVASRRQRRR